MALHDVSPVAKLASIYMADNFDETTGHLSPPLCVSDIAKFACTTVSAVFAALDELAQVGVKGTSNNAEFCRIDRRRGATVILSHNLS
jgi:hypothetical protein